jgi:uncharacterized protein (TIGR02145 family)
LLLPEPEFIAQRVNKQSIKTKNNFKKRKMKKKLFYLVLALVIISAASVNAQVLIGGNETDDPHAGSILDLSPGGSMNMGLLLPKAELTDDANVFALEGDGTSAPATATGMIVYNTANVLDGPGIYLWDGSKWTSLSKPSEVPLSNPCPLTVKDDENNEYLVGNFGDAGCWMTQNLRNTSGLTENEDYLYPGGSKQDYYYETDHGLLYARTATGDACPAGWHLPTNAEVTLLLSEIENAPAGTYATSGTTLAERMVLTEGREWEMVTGYSKTAAEGGFAALPVGTANNPGNPQITGVGATCGFWVNEPPIWDEQAEEMRYWAFVVEVPYAMTFAHSSIASYLMNIRCVQTQE